MSALLTMSIPQTVNGDDIERLILQYTDGFTAYPSYGVWVEHEGGGKVHREDTTVYLVSGYGNQLDALRRSVLAYLREYTDEVALYAFISATGKHIFYTHYERESVVNA